MLSGLQRAASKDGWIVHTLPRPENKGLYYAVLQDWNPGGCIVDCSAGDEPPPDEVFGDRAIIFMNYPHERAATRHTTFLHDSVAVAKMAVAELLETGFGNFAFVPFGRKMSWSDIRGDVFIDEMTAAGKRVRRFSGGKLSTWLSSLPKPCGIFAANDTVAQQVVAIAQQSGLHVPEEIAVVGVDNDEIYCEGIVPGITSIETDLEQAGYRLGEVIINEIKHPSRNPRTVYYKPSRIVRRGSTRLFNMHEPGVMEAVDFIRRYACAMNIGIKDIMEVMKCSRCEATTRFRNATGRSILEEIHEVRFRRMRELLETTSMKTSAVINACGYGSESFPKRLFLKRTGKTMREYRREITS